MLGLRLQDKRYDRFHADVGGWPELESTYAPGYLGRLDVLFLESEIGSCPHED
ncbi:MAG: hypothetical protein WD555_04170 [Fulvivirga sp.]